MNVKKYPTTDAEIKAWLDNPNCPEIFTLEDAREAVNLLRSCHSVETLAKAIAAALARARAEGRSDAAIATSTADAVARPSCASGAPRTG